MEVRKVLSLPSILCQIHLFNSYSLEIGTAQSLQAEACKIIPRVEMNPVLLKSGGTNENGEQLCSVVVLGKQIIRETYGDLQKRTTSLRSMVLESHRALAEATGAEVIVIEGAGSCTELNLMDRDIVNLPLVRSLNVSTIVNTID
jgi:adenosylcobyric acid synthase